MEVLEKFKQSDMFFLLAGPCVIEGEEMAMQIAEHVVKITERLDIPYVFKGSFKKANRSRIDSFTGIGDEKALKILAKVKETFGIPVVTDIHSPEDAELAAPYVDVLQIPAFLCRQTDLLVAAAKTGKLVNIKKRTVPFTGCDAFCCAESKGFPQSECYGDGEGYDIRLSGPDRRLPGNTDYAGQLSLSGCG